MMVSQETFSKVSHCFSDAEELQTFISHIDETMKEINLLVMLRDRVSKDDTVYVLLRQICMFSLLCREHLDLIHQIIGCIETRDLTEEEMEEMREEDA